MTSAIRRHLIALSALAIGIAIAVLPSSESALSAVADMADSSAPAETGSTAARWSWPIAAPRTVAAVFIAPPTPYAAGHRGIDLWLAVGEPVLAPEDGIVHFSGVVVDRPVISLEHSGGLISSFEPVTSDLVAGERVARGEVIGTLAPTLGAQQSGHCWAPCVHLGARLHGQYVSPLKFLGGIPHSVLLPTRELR